MLCKYPFVRGGMAFGCGRCLPCRLNQRRIKTTRIMLESFMHDESIFVGLSYDDENLPEGGNLDKEGQRLWLKRFRRKIEPVKIRFYEVGEYGDENLRPHYHYVFFGIGNRFRYCYTCPNDGMKKRRGRSACNCWFSSMWDKGTVPVGS